MQRRVFVVEPYIPNGGTYMAYHIAKICAEMCVLEGIAVGSTTPEHKIMAYDPLFPLISLEDLGREITARDVLIANPSFSAHHFGLTLPGRKLMYVQDFKTFSLLDCRFDRYVAVSGVVQRFLSAVYDIQVPIIPAFISDHSFRDAPPWAERPDRSIIVSPKLPHIYLDHLRQCLSERGIAVDFTFLPPEKIPQTDMARLIGAHRFFLSLSPAEGFGLMPLEAMAMGTVVMGFDGFGGRDYMRPGENCAVVPYCEIEKMAEMIGALLDDPRAAQALSHEGKLTAQTPKYHYDEFRRAWQGEIGAFMDAGS
jgi:hypothetical protein